MNQQKKVVGSLLLHELDDASVVVVDPVHVAEVFPSSAAHYSPVIPFPHLRFPFRPLVVHHKCSFRNADIVINNYIRRDVLPKS